nr:glycerate kinase [Saprospiraceae bacterium]
DLTDFEAHLDGVNLILTGEGKIDAQTLQGKLISGVVQRARGIPVVALCGTLLADVSAIQRIGLAAAFSILNQPLNLPEALEATPHLLQQTTAQVVSLWKVNG